MTSTGTGAGLRAALVLAAAAATTLLATAPPAAAHGRGSDATNYRSTITEAPDLPGVTWAIHGGDELLEGRNTTGVEVVVLGYTQPDPEPYLRVGPDGVFENRRSPAVYLNLDRHARVAVPPEADPAAEPDWVRRSSADRAAWHDHRIHWMGIEEPPVVLAAGRDTETVVFERWEVPFTYGGELYVVAGELRWVPGPSPWPWLGLGFLLVLPALAGLRTEPRDDRWPGAARPAAVVLGVVVALNATHLVDDLFAVPLPTGVTAVAAVQTVLFLAIGGFGAVRGWQAREGAFTALGVGAGAVLVGQGLLYWSALGASQLASLFPDVLARTVVAASIVQAVPLSVVAVIGTRRTLPPLEDGPVEGGPAEEDLAGAGA